MFSVSPSADLLTGSSGYLASEKTTNYLHEKVHAVRQTTDNCTVTTVQSWKVHV
jgi:hypothetical protein